MKKEQKQVAMLFLHSALFAEKKDNFTKEVKEE